MLSLSLPFFDALRGARSVLVAGAGGGFDVFSGLPVYFALADEGKDVHLANVTFSNIRPDAGERVSETCTRITADSPGSTSYFPEKFLCEWLRDNGPVGGHEPEAYAIERTGAAPVAEAYRALHARLGFDAVVLVDGGTDSLMRGDECGLGTPVEDVASIAAVDALDAGRVPTKVLACLGFGVDAYHGVGHADVLEAVAGLARAGGYLGAWSLTLDMPAVGRWLDATEYVQRRTPGRESIVCHSVTSAVRGQFGDFHRSVHGRTAGSELFVNPLMSIYWTFHLPAVAARLLYLDAIRDTIGFLEMERRIAQFRVGLRETKPWRALPM